MYAQWIECISKMSGGVLRGFAISAPRRTDSYTRIPEKKPDKLIFKASEQEALRATKEQADKENIERGERLLALLNIR